MGRPSIWNCINCMGGTYAPGDEYGRGYNTAIGHVLEIIEGYGLVEGNNVTFATAAEITALREALEECREFFDDRADASIEPGDSYWQGNKEMTLLVIVDDALTPRTRAIPSAGRGETPDTSTDERPQ